ncbi:hypothetical protein [Propionivibrio dicarboxylicus]|nr:hypothetical protein [Propionivibrio dicarboxylicus]
MSGAGVHRKSGKALRRAENVAFKKETVDVVGTKTRDEKTRQR